MKLSQKSVSELIRTATDNRFRHKDAKKFKDITKFIAIGRIGSSTAAYAEALFSITNTGSYTNTDIVGVSVNGGRNSAGIDTAELTLAIRAHSVIIADTQYDRNRPYNTGERVLAEFLTKMGYAEQGNSGIWKSA